MDRNGRGFGFTRHFDRAHNRTVFRFSCVRCPEVLDVAWTKAKCNPQGLADRARAAGWLAEAFRAAAVCPACQETKKAPKASALEAPLGKNEELMQPKLSALPVHREPAPIATKAAPTSVRDATQEERLKIRNLLDKHFDDGAGAYLDGMTDARVAEQVGVPRIMVERIREAAYGPIRVNPEAIKLQGELEALRKAIAKHEQQWGVAVQTHDEAIRRLQTEAATLGARIHALAPGGNAP